MFMEWTPVACFQIGKLAFNNKLTLVLDFLEANENCTTNNYTIVLLEG